MSLDDLKHRKTPLEFTSEEFRTLGYRLIDRIASHFETIRERSVTTDESSAALRRAIGADQSLPVTGAESRAMLEAVSYTHLTLPTIYSV